MYNRMQKRVTELFLTADYTYFRFTRQNFLFTPSNATHNIICVSSNSNYGTMHALMRHRDDQIDFTFHGRFQLTRFKRIFYKFRNYCNCLSDCGARFAIRYRKINNLRVIDYYWLRPIIPLNYNFFLNSQRDDLYCIDKYIIYVIVS